MNHDNNNYVHSEQAHHTFFTNHTAAYIYMAHKMTMFIYVRMYYNCI